MTPISGVVTDPTGEKVRVKFGDSRSTALDVYDCFTFATNDLNDAGVRRSSHTNTETQAIDRGTTIVRNV